MSGLGTRRTAAAVAAAAVACVLVATASALTPTDPLATHPAYAALRLPAAWEIVTGSPDVVVAVVDSGVDGRHPDLAGATVPGYDFVDGDEDASDSPGSGHGTAVAGAAAARAGNGVGGVGACFTCSVMPLRVLGEEGVAALADVARAIDYAVDHGAAVVNVSLYGENSPRSLRDAIVRARAAGVLVVAAAGNEASDVPQFPAAFPGSVAVGAATYDGRRAGFSSYGSWVGYAAPECAPVAVLGGGSGVGCGTSVSAPLVAGVVALMRARAPYASADDVEGALARAARRRPVDGIRTGLVDAEAALGELEVREPRLQPVVLGVPVAGGELEALTGIWAGAKLAVGYQWERCADDTCTRIADATRSTYPPTAADAGDRLRVVVSAAGVDSAASEQTRAVAVRPRTLSRPAIVGPIRAGARLRVGLGTWRGTNLRFTVNWLRCRGPCEQVGTSRSYRVRARDRGYRLHVEVLASNEIGTATAISRRTAIVR